MILRAQQNMPQTNEWPEIAKNPDPNPPFLLRILLQSCSFRRRAGIQDGLVDESFGVRNSSDSKGFYWWKKNLLFRRNCVVFVG